MNIITELLDLEDENVVITNTEIIGNEKYISIEVKLKEHFCPYCNSKMYSRGKRNRVIKHQIMQDGYKVYLKLSYRHWRCINPECNFCMTDEMKFVGKKKRISSATDLMVVNAFRDLTKTSAEIGRQFNISDHKAMDIFMKYVSCKRLPLPEILSVDEVYLDMDRYCKYVLVLQDFITGDSIDLVQSRRKNTIEPYFMNIPRAERDAVKYVVSDMYNPYIDYTKNYFHNALPVVDSFHVLQWITHKIDLFLRDLLKQYKERDRINAERTAKAKHYYGEIHVPLSNEVYLLQNHRWVMLKNISNIEYKQEKKMNYHFGYKVNTYDIENKFLMLHEDLKPLRELKEKYVRFNKRNVGNIFFATEELEDLIDEYAICEYEMFREFASLLKRYKQPIINSFIMFEKVGKDGFYTARMSNGPIESLNRKAKDLKRNSRGYINFDHLRNRFLFATRRNPHWG